MAYKNSSLFVFIALVGVCLLGILLLTLHKSNDQASLRTANNAKGKDAILAEVKERSARSKNKFKGEYGSSETANKESLLAEPNLVDPTVSPTAAPTVSPSAAPTASPTESPLFIPLSLELPPESIVEVPSVIQTYVRPSLVLDKTVEYSLNVFPKLQAIGSSRLLDGFTDSNSVELKVDDVKIVERFHSALTTGNPCIPEAAEYVDFTFTNLMQSMTDLLLSVKPKTLIEYSTGLNSKSVVQQIAATSPVMTHLFVQMGKASTKQQQQQQDKTCNDLQRGSNVFLSTNAEESNSKLRQFMDSSDTELHTPFPLDCVQVIESLTDLVHDQLPYEFEETLGSMVCRCRFTYLPKNLPENSYFSFWDSLSALVTSSVAAYGHPHCGATTDMSNSSVRFIALAKLNQVIVQRYDVLNGTTTTSSDSTASSSSSSTSGSSSSSSSSHYSSRYSRSSSGSSDSVSHSSANSPASAAVVVNPHGGFLPLSVLSGLPLDRVSTANLADSIASYISSAEDAAIQSTEGLVHRTVVESYFDANRGTNTSTVEVDFDAAGLVQWLDSLSVRGASLFNATAAASASAASQRHARYSVPRTLSEESPAAESSTEKPEAVMGSAVSAEVGKSDKNSVPVVIQSTNSSTDGYDHNGPWVHRRLGTIKTSSKSSSSSSSSSSGSGSGTVPLKPYSLSWEVQERHSETGEGDTHDQDIKSVLSDLMSSSKSGSSSSSSDASSGNSFSKTSSSISSSSRVVHRLLQEREDSRYMLWMQYLTTKMPSLSSHGSLDDTRRESGIDQIRRARLVYVLGKQGTMLSVKLAKVMQTASHSSESSSASPAGLVVSLLMDSLSIQPHEQLVQMVNLKNNLVTYPDWTSLSQISNLLLTPERADVGVIQSDVLVKLISLAVSESSSGSSHDSYNHCESLALTLEEALAAVLSLSEVAYVEIPSPAVLRHLLSSLLVADRASSACVTFLSDRYSNRGALLALSVDQLKLDTKVQIREVTPESKGSDEVIAARGIEVYRVVTTYQRSGRGDSLAVDDIFKRGGNKQAGGGAAGAAEPHGKETFSHKGSELGLSVYSAAHFGLLKTHKRILLNMLVNLPLWNLQPSSSSSSAAEVGEAGVTSLVPWQLFLRLSSSYGSAASDLSLWHHNLAESGPIGIGSMHVEGNQGSVSLSRHAAHVAASVTPAELSAKGSSCGISVAENSPVNDRTQGIAVWNALHRELKVHSGELAGGKFSFVEHNSGFGYVSTRLAKEFPNATVISLEKNAVKVAHHVKLVEKLGAINNAVCLKTAEDAVIHKNIYESPEFFRFQLRSHSLMEDFIQAPTLKEWGEALGTLLSTALTTFIFAPNAVQVSWSMYLLFSEVYQPSQREVGTLTVHSASGPQRPYSEVFGAGAVRSAGDAADDLSNLLSVHHPQTPFVNFESKFLLESARVSGGHTTVKISPLSAAEDVSVQSSEKTRQLMIPLVRCDIVNMTRHVHHHYEYSKDGHSRTYTMRVFVNDTLTDGILNHLGDPSGLHSIQLPNGIRLSSPNTLDHHKGLLGGLLDSSKSVELEDTAYGVTLPPGCHPNQHRVTSVYLYRDKDTWPIPYTSVYGITLITALRLGLDVSQRDKMFDVFLKLPLYEDMAPWNVVLMGQTLDYIDYDTREFTYNEDIPKAYRVMSVLMNYKRTVEDFHRCGSKAATPYGLPYVSDCVGTSDKSLVCSDLKLPVPCADGQCHSDYVSCLRSLSDKAQHLAEESAAAAALAESSQSKQLMDQALDNNLVAAMKSVVGRFDDKTFSAVKEVRSA